MSCIGSNLGAIFGASTYCSYAFLSGKNLEKLNEDFADFEDIISIKHVPSATRQAVSNLLGHNDENPNLLKGQYFDYNCCYNGSVEKAYVARALVLCSMVRLPHYYLNQLIANDLIF